jgi:hypothetical protein
MKTQPNNPLGLPIGNPPLTDGLYLVDRGRHLLVHQGALYLPANLLPPGRRVPSTSLVQVVQSQLGRTLSFVRATELVAAHQGMAVKVKAMAERLGVRYE